jgi:hypothetical protein
MHQECAGGQALPEFGATLAADGKAIHSFARGKPEEKLEKEEPDRRRDEDAEWGVHANRGTHKNGTVRETVKKWFGYMLHLVGTPATSCPWPSR